VFHGSSASAWNMKLMPAVMPSTGRRPTLTSPALGRSSPATMVSVVDLPHPVGPTTAQNFPGSMTRSTSRNAVNADPDGVTNRFVTPLKSMCANALATLICSSVRGATKVKWRNTAHNIYVSYVNKPRLRQFCAFCSGMRTARIAGFARFSHVRRSSVATQLVVTLPHASLRAAPAAAAPVHPGRHHDGRDPRGHHGGWLCRRAVEPEPAARSAVRAAGPGRRAEPRLTARPPAGGERGRPRRDRSARRGAEHGDGGPARYVGQVRRGHRRAGNQALPPESAAD